MYRIPLHRIWPQCWWTPSATSSTLWSGAAPAPAGTQRNHWTDRLASPSHSASQQARQGSEKSGLKGTWNKKAKNAPRNNLPGVKKWLSCLAWCPLLPPPPLLHYSHPKGIRGQLFSVWKSSSYCRPNFRRQTSWSDKSPHARRQVQLFPHPPFLSFLGLCNFHTSNLPVNSTGFDDSSQQKSFIRYHVFFTSQEQRITNLKFCSWKCPINSFIFILKFSSCGCLFGKLIYDTSAR